MPAVWSSRHKDVLAWWADVQGGLRAGMWTDVMACGRKGAGRPIPGVPDANRASCRRCLEKYTPKRGQPPVKGVAP